MIQTELVKTAGCGRQERPQLGIKPLTNDIPHDLHGCLSFNSNAKSIYILNNAIMHSCVYVSL